MKLVYLFEPRRTDRPAGWLIPSLAMLAFGAWAGASVASAAEADVPEQVTFSEHVAPILYSHCVTCHRPNDVAPMSLLSYREARPWAKAIRKAVGERAMPPWDADPRYGHFSNDISLSDQQIALIERWVDQGAVEGDPARLPSVPDLPPVGSWKMGRQPDFVIDLAAVDVPASGPDLFVTQVFGAQFPEGTWVQAIELLPGNTKVLHHVVSYLGPFGMDQSGRRMEDDPEFSNSGVNSTIFLNDEAKRPVGMAEAPSVGGVWVAGSPPSEFPEGTGHPLAARQLFSFNMHLHPSGVAGTDASKVGLYFGKGELKKEITTAFAADPGIYIPAGDADHPETAVYLFTQDSQILSFLPHMHQRGKSMRYELTLPDGSQQVLLDVPHYDYNWQNIYHLAKPIEAPAGSLLRVEARWDNSKRNQENPDPSLDVRWGDGTNNEMLVAFFDFIVDQGKKPQPVRTVDTIDSLLALHAPADAYEIRIDGMAFGGPWGLVVPEQGEGTFYVTFGPLMFSTSMPEAEHVGDDLLLHANIITGGGGSRMPLTFVARRGEDGTISGESFFGKEVSASELPEMRGKGRAFSGQSRASLVSSSAGR